MSRPPWFAAAPALEPIDNPYDIHRGCVQGLLHVGARQSDRATPSQIKAMHVLACSPRRTVSRRGALWPRCRRCEPHRHDTSLCQSTCASPARPSHRPRLMARRRRARYRILESPLQQSRLYRMGIGLPTVAVGFVRLQQGRRSQECQAQVATCRVSYQADRSTPHQPLMPLCPYAFAGHGL